MVNQEPSCSGDIGVMETGGILSINLDALVSNWRSLRDLSGEAECAAVVKANAYGLGIEEGVPALLRAGCKTFFVAHLSEGLRVRKCTPNSVIFVLNGLVPAAAAVFAQNALSPVLGSPYEIAQWAAFCAENKQRFPAAIHIDTGMSRLGLSVAETHDFAATLRDQPFDLTLVMSHFIRSEEAEHPINQKQIDTFSALLRLFPGIPASLANSSGIFLPQKPHFNLVRPGYALYGGNPLPEQPNPMKPVIKLQARIIQIRDVPLGTDVGYNGRWTSPKPCRLATISVGYADGYPRSASGTSEKHAAKTPAGAVLINGILCPLVGTISMDLMVIDVSDVPVSVLQPGAVVTLIGDCLTIDSVGENAGTIGYEILTNLGQRYTRHYISSDCRNG